MDSLPNDARRELSWVVRESTSGIMNALTDHPPRDELCALALQYSAQDGFVYVGWLWCLPTATRDASRAQGNTAWTIWEPTHWPVDYQIGESNPALEPELISHEEKTVGALEAAGVDRPERFVIDCVARDVVHLLRATESVPTSDDLIAFSFSHLDPEEHMRSASFAAGEEVVRDLVKRGYFEDWQS